MPDLEPDDLPDVDADRPNATRSGERGPEPSATAQRVAAYRLEFERLPAPFGDPAADERLMRDVSAQLTFAPSDTMARYLRGRTAFFDRVVVNALERDITQVAAIGAGYDGRSLRYARPGVRWFEVDHPATQDDKRRRLGRLEIETPHVSFVALDLARSSVANALLDAGWEPDALSLMLCEGLTIYLGACTIRTLLADLRALATVGTRLAASWSATAGTPEQVASRERLRTSVAGLGEPARNTIAAEDVPGLLASTRWHPVDISERAQRAGFGVAAPVWQPPRPTSPATRTDTGPPATETDTAPPATRSHIGRFMERMFDRAGNETLPGHLRDTYGIAVRGIRELDLGVFRVDRADGNPWIARVFPAARSASATHGDAEILRFLEQRGFPAERCAHPEPVSEHHDQAVLVTEHVSGNGRTQAPARLGELLGQLHRLRPAAGAPSRPGGAWHHLVLQGGPPDEIAAIVSLLEAARPRVRAPQQPLYDALREELERADDCSGLPESLIHPDFVPANAIGPPLTLVDWTGAGRGPRLWSLAFLLWAAGYANAQAVDAVCFGYRRHADLTPAELGRLAPAIATRPVIFSCWAFCTGRRRLAEVVEELPGIRARAERIAAQARAAFATPRATPPIATPL